MQTSYTTIQLAFIFSIDEFTNVDEFSRDNRGRRGTRIAFSKHQQVRRESKGHRRNDKDNRENERILRVFFLHARGLHVFRKRNRKKKRG